MTEVLGEWVASGDWSQADAVRVAELVGAGKCPTGVPAGGAVNAQELLDRR